MRKKQKQKQKQKWNWKETERQMEIDLYPDLKVGQEVKITGIDFTGNFDLIGLTGIVEACAPSCRFGISVWIVGFKIGSVYPVILEYDIYSIEPTGIIKTPWHQLAPRTQHRQLQQILN